MLLDQLTDSWHGRGLGIELSKVGYVSYLVWADNIYFLAHSREHLSIMITEFSSKLYSLGLFWKASSLESLCTHPLDPGNELVVNAGAHELEFKHVTGMKLLGTLLSTTNLI